MSENKLSDTAIRQADYIVIDDQKFPVKPIQMNGLFLDPSCFPKYKNYYRLTIFFRMLRRAEREYEEECRRAECEFRSGPVKPFFSWNWKSLLTRAFFNTLFTALTML